MFRQPDKSPLCHRRWQFRAAWLFSAVIVAFFELFATSAIADDADGLLSTVDNRIEQHRKRDAVVRFLLPDGTSPATGSAVSIDLERHLFYFGANFFLFGESSGVAEASYRERFHDVMNLAVLPFYWHTYEPQRGQTLANRWTEAAKWCHDNNIRTKGHPLVWNMEPNWLRNVSATDAEQLLWGRIESEVGNFRGLVDMWDVINETTEGMKYAKQRSATGLLGVYNKYGITRVTKHAFELARQTNPSATLILNDYDTTDAYVQTITKALAAGASIDAIGIQSHMHTEYWGVEKLWDVCERLSSIGKPIHFTELTVLSGKLKSSHDHDWETQRTNWHSTASGEQTQATQVREIYHLLFSHPSVEAIVWWDLTDKHAWQGAPGGLLRRDLSPKPAYYVIRDLVTKGWSTHVAATTNADGQATYRGFYGDYATTVTHAGHVYQGTFHLAKTDDGPIDVPLVAQ